MALHNTCQLIALHRDVGSRVIHPLLILLSVRADRRRDQKTNIAMYILSVYKRLYMALCIKLKYGCF